MQIWKNTFKGIFWLGIISILVACSSSETSEEDYDNDAYLSQFNTENAWYKDSKTIVGNAFGTQFIVKTSDDSLYLSPQEIEDFLNDFNAELSTYIPTSLISKFNDKDTIIDLNSTKYFKPCFELSQKIYEHTNGSFDPTVFPLVNLWGFVKKINKVPTQTEIDSVLSFVGFEENKLYKYENGILTKHDKRFKLVFNAIAKGQAVDELANFLEKMEQQNYYVEIGGEIRVKGLNDRKGKWLIGVDAPLESNTGLTDTQNRPIENYLEITNCAMATSGNYRDYYILNDEEYGHTISSTLGKPIKSNLLSATVIAKDVATADAYATAFMVMGVDSTLELIRNNPELGIDAYLLFDNGKGGIGRAYNKGMLKYLMD